MTDHLAEMPALDRPTLDLIAEVAEGIADRPALVAARVWTYGQLVEDGHAVARAVARRVAPGARVAVAIEDPAPRAIAAMAVARAGGIALSVAARGGPAARMRDHVQRAGASLVLHDGDEAWLEEIAAGVPTLAFDEACQTTTGSLPSGITIDHPSEIVFTSGSTGKPKLVLRTPRGLAGSLHMARSLSLGGDDRISFVDIGTFGGAWGNVESALLCGTAVHCVELRSLGPAGFCQWLAAERITWTRGLPSYLRVAFGVLAEGEVLPHLRVVQLGGDLCRGADARLVASHLGPEATVVVGYGATEARLVAWGVVPAQDLEADGVIACGHPLPGQPVAIVGEGGEHATDGEAGQVRVTAPSTTFTETAQGPQLPTVTEFLVGDRGRLLPDGRLVVLGRADDVLLIAGRRVDPLEVEVAIASHPQVQDAAVVADELSEAVLAVVVALPGMSAPSLRALRDHLAGVVHDSAVPVAIVHVQELPRLVGGKLDRKRLQEVARAGRPGPGPVVDRGARPVVPDLPVDRIVERMAAVLGVPVEHDDDFFDLGGSSMQAARLYAHLYADFGVDLPLSTLLEARTPRALGALVSGTPAVDHVGLLPIRATGDKCPVFVCHGGQGNILFVRFIAQGLSQDRPVWAIQAPYADGRRPTETSVEQLALRYSAALQAQQPQGPLLLVGYSFSGHVVAEMARFLHEAGREVCFVGLGDTGAAGSSLSDVEGLEGLAGRAGVHRQNLARRTPSALPGYVRYVVRKRWRRGVGRVAWRLLPPGSAVPHWAREQATEVHVRRLVRNYRPAPFPIALTLFRATKSSGPADRSWGPLAPEGLEIITIDATHTGLREQEDGPVWGAAIEAALQSRGC